MGPCCLSRGFMYLPSNNTGKHVLSSARVQAFRLSQTVGEANGQFWVCPGCYARA